MFGDNLERIVAAIEKNYEADEIFFTKPGRRFPSRTAIKGLITELRRVLFLSLIHIFRLRRPCAARCRSRSRCPARIHG